PRILRARVALRARSLRAEAIERDRAGRAHAQVIEASLGARADRFEAKIGARDEIAREAPAGAEEDQNRLVFSLPSLLRATERRDVVAARRRRPELERVASVREVAVGVGERRHDLQERERGRAIGDALLARALDPMFLDARGERALRLDRMDHVERLDA